ncbi:hypothetical protein [Streptomyces sp. NPDC053048]|uniref:hypothetical protein n=1 Tax=Streptomyces sp. NPDC053048 TaxID=3365694 RepID=UPI0037D123B7
MAGVLAARAAEERWLQLLGVALRAEKQEGAGERALSRRAAAAMSRTLVRRALGLPESGDGK